LTADVILKEQKSTLKDGATKQLLLEPAIHKLETVARAAAIEVSSDFASPFGESLA
jgi:hypothetical protein